MPNPLTPGQLAYEAFWRVLAPRYGELQTPYGGITALQVEAWEAAAQAVLAMHEEDADA
jgi:hypothetical protein